MKQTPALDRVQAKMQPGEIALHGFLGHDPRKLIDIIAADAMVVARHGVTNAQIADRLDDIAVRGADLAEREVMVDEHFAVTVRDDRGVLPSPWGDGRWGKGEVHMTETRTGAKFAWNELVTHMIREYGFYGGQGSHYRIDPAAIIAALELAPGDDATSVSDATGLSE